MSTTGTTASRTRGRLPAARRDRRPALAALALLLILGGALGSALLVFRSGDRVDVLVARQDIPVGTIITRGDLTTARVSADGGKTLEAEALDSFIGTQALSTIPAGTLVNNQMFFGGSILPEGAQLVGVVVDITRRTISRPEAGDVVRVYFVSGAGEQTAGDLAPGGTVVEAARVIDTGSGGGSDSMGLSLLVSDDEAGRVADLASSGSLAVSLLPPATEPDVDIAD